MLKDTAIVIRDNRVFTRETYDIPLAGFDELVDEKLREKPYMFMPWAAPPMLKKADWIRYHIFGTTPGEKQILLFSKIESIPLPGIEIRPVRGAEDGSYGLHIPNHSEDYLDYTDPAPEARPEKWTPPSHLGDFFVMVAWNTCRRQVEKPILFAVNTPDFRSDNPALPKLWTPLLPNVHNTGHYCMGPGYGNRNDATVTRNMDLPVHHLSWAVGLIAEDPVGPDLRSPHIDTETVRWTAEGESHADYYPKRRDEVSEVTDERAVRFAEWFVENREALERQDRDLSQTTTKTDKTEEHNE